MEGGCIVPRSLAAVLVDRVASNSYILDNLLFLFLGRQTSVVPAVLAKPEMGTPEQRGTERRVVTEKNGARRLQIRSLRTLQQLALRLHKCVTRQAEVCVV